MMVMTHTVFSIAGTTLAMGTSNPVILGVATLYPVVTSLPQILGNTDSCLIQTCIQQRRFQETVATGLT